MFTSYILHSSKSVFFLRLLLGFGTKTYKNKFVLIITTLMYCFYFKDVLHRKSKFRRTNCIRYNTYLSTYFISVIN